MARAEHVYATASTNRYSQAADVVGPGLVAFGSGKLVALWDAAVEYSPECATRGYCSFIMRTGFFRPRHLRYATGSRWSRHMCALDTRRALRQY